MQRKQQRQYTFRSRLLRISQEREEKALFTPTTKQFVLYMSHIEIEKKAFELEEYGRWSYNKVRRCSIGSRGE